MSRGPMIPVSVSLAPMAAKLSAQEKLGQAIRIRRKKLGYSQEGFAANCEVDRAYMGRIERGDTNPTFLLLLRVSKELRCSLAELFAAAEL